MQLKFSTTKINEVKTKGTRALGLAGYKSVMEYNYSLDIDACVDIKMYKIWICLNILNTWNQDIWGNPSTDNWNTLQEINAIVSYINENC
jgi:hypothetical protein